MNEKLNPNELLPYLEAVDDVSSFRSRWKEVIDDAIEGYDVSRDERDGIIEELTNSHMETEREVLKDDVLEALNKVRFPKQSLN